MTLLDPGVDPARREVEADTDALIKEARRLRRRRWLFGSALAALAACAGLAGYLTGSSSPPASHHAGVIGAHSPGSSASPSPAFATTGTFLSLLRVCRLTPPRDRLLTGCVGGHYDLALEQFSLSTGRRIRTVTQVLFSADTPAPFPPAGTTAGTVLLTATTGARCLKDGKPLRGVYMECQPSRNSCINTVMQLSPTDPTPTRLLTVPSNQTIGAVVPSPNGSEIAYSAQPCVGTHPLPGLFVRSLKTGATREIAKATYCSSIGQPAWNAAGTEVAFRMYAAPPGSQAGTTAGSSGPACTEAGNPRWRLVITSTAPQARWMRLPPLRRGCSIAAAAFDSRGILMAEGCSTGHESVTPSGATRGPAYLLQYTDRGRLTARIPLPHPGLDPEQTLIAREPHSDKILITQDQPTGLVARNDDHIYELTGAHLRQVIENSWGSDFMAVPW